LYQNNINIAKTTDEISELVITTRKSQKNEEPEIPNTISPLINQSLKQYLLIVGCCMNACNGTGLKTELE
jgi:hypothetical protein